jgi:homogentisate 1,2-dioxygenase
MPTKEAFYSSDGDFLIVLQQGVLDIQTVFGRILVRRNEIAVIPRGIKYRIDLPNGPVRGYILEIYDGHFKLPELGPIGSNGLANARDFQMPVAAFDDWEDSPWIIYNKYNNTIFAASQAHTPFDVVAWYGNYYPYKYSLGRFNTIGSTSFDHRIQVSIPCSATLVQTLSSSRHGGLFKKTHSGRLGTTAIPCLSLWG